MGTNVRSTSVPYPKLSELTIDGSGRVTSSTGYLQEILNQLSRQLNFTVELSVSVDGKFGSPVAGSGGTKWNGMVGMLMDNKYYPFFRARTRCPLF